MLRDIARGIADFIGADEVLHERGHVTVVVEDKDCVRYQVEQALAQLGVCVLVAVTGFQRVGGAPFPQGTLKLQISCYEHPELNRTDCSTLTAQGVMEQIVKILHYRRFPFLANKLIFNDFSRDDVEEANIVRGDFEANTLLGYEDEWVRRSVDEARAESADTNTNTAQG